MQDSGEIDTRYWYAMRSRRCHNPTISVTVAVSIIITIRPTSYLFNEYSDAELK
jgi:hypothetical protein